MTIDIGPGYDRPAFNAYAAYQSEREYSHKLEEALSAALSLLDMENGRRALRGEDVGHLQAFVKQTREIWA